MNFFLFPSKTQPSATTPNKFVKNNESNRSTVTQSPIPPIPPFRQNGSSPHPTTISPRMASPVYANTNKQQTVSPQPPPVPAKPAFRPSPGQFIPINGDHNNQKQSKQNGVDFDEVKKIGLLTI